MIANRGYNATPLLVAFLAGAAVGAVTALLTAPRSGRETRARLGDAVRTARDRTTLVVGGAYDRATRAMKAAGEELRTPSVEEAEHVGH